MVLRAIIQWLSQKLRLIGIIHTIANLIQLQWPLIPMNLTHIDELLIEHAPWAAACEQLLE